LTPSNSVFPTLVGVFPRARPVSPSRTRLPHARGGVSSIIDGQRWTFQSSPRSWGCFTGRDRRVGKKDQSSPRSWGCFLIFKR